MQIKKGNHAILKFTLLEINLKKMQLLIPWYLGDYDIQTSKFYYFGVFFIMNFFIPKLTKIR